MIGCEDIGKSREREWASHMALVVKNPPANEGDVKDTSSTPGLGRSGGGHGNPLQYREFTVHVLLKPGLENFEHYFTISHSLLKFMTIESVMLSNHLILCRPLLLPSVFPILRVSSNKSVLRIRWPKYWSFSFSYQSFQ